MGRFLLHYSAISLLTFSGVFNVGSEAFAATQKGNIKEGSTRRKSKAAPSTSETLQQFQSAPLASTSEVSPSVTSPAQKSLDPNVKPVRPRFFLMQPGNAPVGHVDLSALAGAGYFWGFFHYDLGARMGVRLYDPGFIPMLNNSVAVDVGLFYNGTSIELGGYGYRAHYLQVPVYLRWDFHLTPAWTVFPMVGPEISMLLGASYYANEQEKADYRRMAGKMDFDLGFGIGAFWHLAENASIRFEIDRGHGLFRVGGTLRI